MDERPSPVQVARDHYQFAAFEKPTRFQLYYHVAHTVTGLRPRTVLEVGPGSGIVTAALRFDGIAVTTLDFDRKLRPGVCADIRRLPFGPGAFDVVLASQVLEHLPPDDLDETLAALARTARSHVVISVPYNRHHVALALSVKVNRYLYFGGRVNRWLQRHGNVYWNFGVPQSRRPFRPNGEHHWELGYKEYPVTWFRERLAPWFEIRREFRVPQSPYHYVFVLACRPDRGAGAPSGGLSRTPAGGSSRTH
jgi:Methyltransferase domain